MKISNIAESTEQLSLNRGFQPAYKNIETMINKTKKLKLSKL